jgi:hypothetical protein
MLRSLGLAAILKWLGAPIGLIIVIVILVNACT